MKRRIFGIICIVLACCVGATIGGAIGNLLMFHLYGVKVVSISVIIKIILFSGIVGTLVTGIVYVVLRKLRRDE